MPETTAHGERTHRGTPVCGGIAIGPLHRLRGTEVVARTPSGDPAEEVAAFRAALATATAEIEALLASEDALAGDILEFQAALLDDEELVDPIADAIASGTPADDAWCAALDTEIAAYREDGDPVLTARADDLADLRDRVRRALAGAQEAADVPVPDGAILVAAELTPSTFLALDHARLGGIATTGGSATSHVSILARARGVTLIVGLDALPAAPDGSPAILDAGAGRLVTHPACATLADASTRRRESDAARASAAAHATEPAITADGVAIRVLVNIDDPAMLDRIDPATCDGVGLTRTEFLFTGGTVPDEDTQLTVYNRLLAWADGPPVTVRTLDAGGDKPLPGITIDGEANPFLGVRGIRLSLARPALFRVQLRALARAAATANGRLKVMLPMVTVPAELEAARALLAEEIDALANAGIAAGWPVLGMMVEVPAAALTAGAFDAAFYSVGSNDLIQYATASARDNPALASLADPASAAVLELIARTVAAGAERGVEVSLCGDMASSPALVPALLLTGLRTFSVAPAEVGAVKSAIRAATCGPAGG